MTDVSSQTLHIVAKELASTLNEARAALESFAERPDQTAYLEKCADQLHLSHGVLRLVEVYGAALLAEEMEYVTRYLLHAVSDQKRQMEGLDALMRAMVQLPTYLERVMSGGRDLALVLLPLLNDLRSVRGSPLLSEGTLLLLNLKSDQPAQPQEAAQGERAGTVAQSARRLRPKFQVGLLGYIRGERTVQNLEVLAKVAEKLEQVATTQPVFQLWWVVGAVLEAVRGNGLEGSATLKRLLGQADRQIKALYEKGEARYADNPPVDLLNNLLYYVARASTDGGRVSAVRASFKLAELLPVDDSIEHERESLSAPSVKLMRTVAAAIKEDLSKVKDVLDIFVRRGGGRPEEIIPQLDLLKKISDTLGVLGLGELRLRVQQEILELSDIVTDGKTPSEAALIKVAGVLLSVEDSLDDQLVRLILPTARKAPAEAEGDGEIDFRLVSEAVLRECIVNLARIKEAVSVAVQKPTDFPLQGIDNVPQLLRGITAGLLMLGKGRAVELMDAVGGYVRQLVEPGAPSANPLRLERIADAIVSIEYYMETLQNGRADPWYMLDNAEICIKALEQDDVDAAAQADAGRAAAVGGAVPADAAQTAALSPTATTPDYGATVAMNGAEGLHASTNPHAAVAKAEPVDPSFVELFIEEAKEEIASIQRSFPSWDQNPMDLDSLSSLRRSFHTLKGSGRMVGARLIAEFGWSIENLLNRIIDKTLSRTPGMMSLFRNAVAILPDLVEQLETGRQNAAPAGEIMARAFAHAEGREPGRVATPRTSIPAPSLEASAGRVGSQASSVTETLLQDSHRSESLGPGSPPSPPGVAAPGVEAAHVATPGVETLVLHEGSETPVARNEGSTPQIPVSAESFATMDGPEAADASAQAPPISEVAAPAWEPRFAAPADVANREAEAAHADGTVAGEHETESQTEFATSHDGTLLEAAAVEPSIEPPLEVPTEAPIEAPIEASAQPLTEPPAERRVDSPIESQGDARVAAPGEPPAEPMTEPPMGRRDVEPPFDARVDAPTGPPTERPTERRAEAPLEPRVEASSVGASSFETPWAEPRDDASSEAPAVEGLPADAPDEAWAEPPAEVPDEVLSAAVEADAMGEYPLGDDVPSMDGQLHEIYSKEARSHLAELREYLAKRRERPAPHDVTESVYRAVHTLSGSSKMAEARHGIRITEPLHHYMRKAFDAGVGLSDAGLQALAEAVREIDNVISHINESTIFFVDQPALLRRLHDLEAELDAHLSRKAGDTDSSGVVPQLAPHLADAADSADGGDAAGAADAAKVTGADDAADAAEVAGPADAAETADADAAAVTGAAGAPGAAEVAGPAEAADAAEEFDHEIANIYSEEATELLEAAEASLSAWNRDRRDQQRVAELQRQLHTLKGGARMAGIRAMGDLSHELETLVIQIDGGAVPGDDYAHSLMQTSLDELARMRDMVGAGSMPADATALLARIRALADGGGSLSLPSEEDVALSPTAGWSASRDLDAGQEAARRGGYAVPAADHQGNADGRNAVNGGGSADRRGTVDDLGAGAGPGAADAGSDNADAAAHPADADAPLPGEADAAGAGHAGVRETADANDVAANEAAYADAGASEAAHADAEDAAAEAAEPGAAEDSAAPAEPSSAPALPGRDSVPAERAEMARVDADLLDTMLNNAGEVSIFRARLDQQVNSIDFNLAELARTVVRLKGQLRSLEIETEAQVLNRHQDEDQRRSDFDPLELDRYSALQQYSRALAETSSDVASIQGLLETLTREAQNLLTQQARVITELQNGLMRTRMVPFQRHVQRLMRLVRQAANDTGKRAELVVQGAAAELDRQMLERMVAPLEHMLRNAVVHGIETQDRRAAQGKPETGRISVSLTRDGAEVAIVVTDDGSGVNVKLIREKALSLGIIDRHAKLTDEEALQLILEPGFSTAGRLTQAAGRGVGMDVVATEVKKLGGGLFIEATPGVGSRFTIRLPFTLAISQALIVRVAEEVYALPLATVEGVVRLPRNIVARHLGKDAPLFEYGGQKYRFQQLGAFVGVGPTRLPETDVSMSVVLIRAGEHSTALVTDELVGSREIVVKSLGPQISGIRGIAGATILGDGRIVVILDMGSLVRSEWRARPSDMVLLDHRDRRTFALVVDDSITVRRVTQRLLERNGMRVLTAKDGVDAVSLLQENLPDIILLDIEMPRMDGYEVATHVRNDPRLKNIPIVMITSRVSEKHRARAIEIGVDDYLGKPYQESQLLDAIEPLVNRAGAVAR